MIQLFELDLNENGLCRTSYKVEAIKNETSLGAFLPTAMKGNVFRSVCCLGGGGLPRGGGDLSSGGSLPGRGALKATAGCVITTDSHISVSCIALDIGNKVNHCRPNRIYQMDLGVLDKLVQVYFKNNSNYAKL